MKIKQISLSILGPLLSIFIISVWIVGAIHGKKKHDLKPFSEDFYLPWYYGFESFWHKIDYQELNDDVTVTVYLLMNESDGKSASDQLEIAETRTKLKKRLGKLNNKETAYVKEGVGKFCDYFIALQDEMFSLLTTFKTNQTVKAKLNPSTVKLGEDCNKYGLNLEIEKSKEIYKQLVTQIYILTPDKATEFSEKINVKELETYKEEKKQKVLALRDNIFNN